MDKYFAGKSRGNVSWHNGKLELLTEIRLSTLYRIWIVKRKPCLQVMKSRQKGWMASTVLVSCKFHFYTRMNRHLITINICFGRLKREKEIACVYRFCDHLKETSIMKHNGNRFKLTVECNNGGTCYRNGLIKGWGYFFFFFNIHHFSGICAFFMMSA